jgi:hypothetical protein
MGENVSAGREGPNAQGVLQSIPASEEASAPGQDHTPISANQESSLRKRLADIKPLGVPFRPSVPSSAAEFVRAGYGTSTVAANNFAGIITDRFASLTGTMGRRTPRSPAEKDQRRNQGILTQLSAEDIQALKDAGKKWRRHAIKDSLKKEVVAKLVQGRYASDGMEGKTGKGTTVGSVRRQLMRNESFLKSDVEKVVGRVQAFLSKEAWKKIKPENGQQQGEL